MAGILALYTDHRSKGDITLELSKAKTPIKTTP